MVVGDPHNLKDSVGRYMKVKLAVKYKIPIMTVDKFFSHVGIEPKVARLLLETLSAEITCEDFGKLEDSHICSYKGILAFVHLSSMAHALLSQKDYKSEHLHTVDHVNWLTLVE